MNTSEGETLKSVLGIAGSLRRASYNRRLLNEAAHLGREELRLRVYEELDQVPLFNEEHEHPIPHGVLHLREAVRAADGLLIATPEYNQSMPGILKNAIDWISREEALLKGKPVAIIGATIGSWGTRLAQAAVRQTLAATGARVMPQPMLFIARAGERFDSDGRLHDVATVSGLTEVVRAFRLWIDMQAFGVRPRG